MLVRPDFYLYGAVAEAGEVNRLVDDLAADLARHGVRLGGAREASMPIRPPA
jgi:3-(3-hydroxy-phenyl)propionate hydroxylase/flavoprotein hydroxylase